MAKLLYGGGLRLMECIRLRVKDLDFGQGLISIRGGKGGKDRTTILPKNVQDELLKQVQAVKALHYKDLEEGFGEVYIPEALARKYPNAGREIGWQWVFPSRERSIDPRSGKAMRHHVLESGLQKAVKRGEYPGAPGTPRPCRRQDHRDLYPCHGQGHSQAGKSTGSFLTSAA